MTYCASGYIFTIMNKNTEIFTAYSENNPDKPERTKIKGKFFLMIFFLLAFMVSLGVTSGVFFLYRLYQTLPTLTQMQNIEQPLVTKVYGKDSTLIHEFSIERRYWVSLDEIPQTLQDAVIAIEDRRFYKHWGIDVRRIFGAIVIDIIRGGYAQGASTLTQQLARNVYLTSKSSMIRKLREALTAAQLESCYTKREILELYLNQVYLGAGVYGVEAASERFFNKSVSELNLNECAVIAGMIQLPERYRPDKKENIPRITDRRNTVLRAMIATGVLDKATVKEVSAQSVVANPHIPRAGVGAYFIEMVRKYVSDKYGTNLLYNGGLEIYTTLDPLAQDSAENAAEVQCQVLQKRLNRMFLDSSRADRTLNIRRDVFLANFDSIYNSNSEQFKDFPDSLKLRKAQISVIALEPSTGAIRVLIGGRNFAESKFNRAIMARRQPGSSFKPIVYTAALENGYHPASVVLDQPITLMTPEGEWRPENYDRVFNGPITIRNALAKSINLVAIQVFNKVGANIVIQYARKMGLKHRLNPVPALAIGAAEVTPMEMTSAYSVYANQGIQVKPYLIEQIVDRTGRVIETNTPEEEVVLSPQTAFLMASLLKSVVCCGTGASIPGRGFRRPAGGKTGTTNDYSDAWFIGFTPQIVCCVWNGVDERRSMGHGVTGSMASIPVWVKTMIPLHEDLPVENFKMPSGIKTEKICKESHLIATSACPKEEEEFFLAETEIDTCDIHGTSRINKDQNMIKMFSAPDKKRPKSIQKKKRPLMF